MQQALAKHITIEPLELLEKVANANIYADPKHVHQIVINLMSNAVKYTPDGGSVRLEAQLVSDKVRIEVHDTGVGISEEKLKTLFQRFERGEDTYSRGQEGTGIGLNLTKSLIELNGGRIGVESVLNQGSCFWILLPLSMEAPSTAKSEVEARPTAVRLDGLSAVIVDDNVDTCEVLKHILHAAGADVRTAYSVRDGIALIDDNLPDIILTDLAIPGESGLQLIQHVRKEREQYGSVPIMVLSACAFERDQDAALDAGASVFIPKPFKPNEIIQTVRQLTLAMAMQGD